MPIPTDIVTLLSTATPAIITFSKPMGQGAWTEPQATAFGLPVRPDRVVVRRDTDVRVECFTPRQSFTSNHDAEALAELLELLWDAGYGQLLLQTPDADVQVLRSAKRVTVKRAAPTRTAWSAVSADRVKPRPLEPERDAALLHALDLSTAEGRILAPMADKYRQLNHLIEIALALDVLKASAPLHIVDAGCGKAYLSLALVHVLRRAGRDVSMTGIDTNPHVIDHARRVAQELGQSTSRFLVGSIADLDAEIRHVDPQPSRTLLIALHACDTATDEALMLGLRMQADAMLVAPCCHHYVQKQLRKQHVPEAARLLLDDGITKERLGDLLTDTMRRDIVRAHGYEANLEEFISLEHTMKNILLKAQRSDAFNATPDLTNVLDACTRWGARPRLLDLVQP